MKLNETNSVDIDMSRKIDCLIVGAQKAASSSIHFSLLNHPQVAAKREESTIFEDPFYTPNGVRQKALEYFSSNPKASVVLLKRPNLLCTDGIAERVKNHNPRAKIIIVLRDPAARAASAALHYMKVGFLPVQNLNCLLRRIFSKNSLDLSETESAIREHGLYGHYIEKWLQCFSSEQICLLIQNDFVGDFDWNQGVCSFLNIDIVDLPERLNSAQSKAAIRSRVRLIIHSFTAKLLRKRIYGTFFTRWRSPRIVARALSYGFSVVDRFVLSRICRSSSEFSLSAEVLMEIKAFYKDDIKKCESLIQRDLSSWL